MKIIINTWGNLGEFSPYICSQIKLITHWNLNKFSVFDTSERYKDPEYLQTDAVTKE